MKDKNTIVIERVIYKQGKGIKLKCPKCKYEWVYSGSLKMATCSNCYNKVKVKDVTK